MRRELAYFQIVTEVYFWDPTDPAYELARPVAERLMLLMQDFIRYDSWVLSGSLIRWGNDLIPFFDLIVVLYVEPELRLQRLQEREYERYGERILKGGDLYEKSRAFLEWAAAYDDENSGIGRIYSRHMQWIEMLRNQLDIPVLEIRGDVPLEYSVETVLSAMDSRS